MTKRKIAGKSIFSNLPLDLRTTLRSQTLVPLVPGVNIKQHQLPADGAEGEARNLLPTQPASPSSSTASMATSVRAVVNGTGESSKRAASLTALDVSVASASGQGQKRRRKDDGPAKANVKGKGKGKAKPVKHAWDCTGLVQRYTDPSEVPPHIVKYWYQRHFLLPQYDTLPLLLDDTGWFSITPQPIAQHIAERCRCDVIIDAFCGVGGNAIEFAKTCERVIAIDNNPIRLRLARHNALHLGVADRIEFVLGDFVSYAESMSRRRGGKGEEVDVVFLSPPWGGVDYLSFADPASSASSSYPLSAILPIHGKKLFDLTSTLTPNIAYYLPRNTNVDELADLARPVEGPPLEDGTGGTKRDKEWVEVEEEWVGDKLKAVTAYFGGLIADE